jgi:predicted nuclease with TOPRIM domain
MPRDDGVDQPTAAMHDPLSPDLTIGADGVTPVRVEVVDNGNGMNPSIDSLRRSIAIAEQRLGTVRELKQQLEESQQQLQELHRENEQLCQELNQARLQLSAFETLQRELEALLENG